ncbi:hypothetical protein HUT19_05785 [Streptomyces sp. NA02950]|uniref:hypothetical protein n=1 Tax=Streptomyces sp. NA02950 TaxID=2742137 RepID=UPI00159196ED|nr:hypothetical protein [Streptomyces sp. NA02950]QKV91310.1 hypothetical protein HUT19_05785 [Streptomyces sp. NA02950]
MCVGSRAVGVGHLAHVVRVNCVGVVSSGLGWFVRAVRLVGAVCVLCLLCALCALCVGSSVSVQDDAM